MTLDPSIEQALHSPEPFSHLRLLVRELFSRGASQETVLALFEDSRQALREAGREADEDVVMDVMDCLVGWCGAHMKLEPEPAEVRMNGYNGVPEAATPKKVSPLDKGTANDE